MTQKNPSQIRMTSIDTFDRSAKPRWLLLELGLSFEDHRLNPKAGDLDSPEFLRLNPMGRVPVLEIGDAVLFESGAICLFLADLHPEGGLAPPPSSPLRPEYLQWMLF